MRTLLLLSLLFAALPAAAARRSLSVDAGFKKADLLIEKGEFAKAREELDEALGELKPDDSRRLRYHERTGASWLREGNIPEARAAFTEALVTLQRLKLGDEYAAKAYTGMGLCLRREKNDKYALKFFKKALAYRLDEGTRMFVEDQIREIEGEPPVPAR